MTDRPFVPRRPRKPYVAVHGPCFTWWPSVLAVAGVVAVVCTPIIQKGENTPRHHRVTETLDLPHISSLGPTSAHPPARFAYVGVLFQQIQSLDDAVCQTAGV